MADDVVGPRGTDEQDVAEAQDVDKLASDALDDEPDLGDYPPGAPIAADDYGVTDREQAIPEPLEERVAREEPDPLRDELDDAARRSPDR